MGNGKRGAEWPEETEQKTEQAWNGWADDPPDLGVDEVFYLQTRGLDEAQAKGLIVSGFIDPLTSELPLPDALELNRQVRLEMTGTLG